MENNERFQEEAMAINSRFPTLFYKEEQGQPTVVGSVLLMDDDILIDEYKIRIVAIPEYPARFPHVYETGGRLPHNVDWHVHLDGHCCIKAIPEEILICHGGITLETFITGQVIPYFFNQKHRELHGFFLHERDHGIAGNLQFFEDIFKTSNIMIIGKGLFALWRDHLPNRVGRCFCGSGNKYRHCHKEVLTKLSSYSKDDLAIFLSMIHEMMRRRGLIDQSL